MATLEWRAERDCETALLVLADLIPIKLRAERSRWVIEGADGRKREGPIHGIEEAKKQCLRAVQTALTRGVMEVTWIQHPPKPPDEGSQEPSGGGSNGYSGS